MKNCAGGAGAFDIFGRAKSGKRIEKPCLAINRPLTHFHGNGETAFKAFVAPVCGVAPRSPRKDGAYQ
jgi:hypothetical protein